MNLKLVVDNSETIPILRRGPRERPQDRLTSAWRAMQSVMNDHLQGNLSDQVAITIIYGYLDDARLNAAIRELDR